MCVSVFPLSVHKTTPLIDYITTSPYFANFCTLHCLPLSVIVSHYLIAHTSTFLLTLLERRVVKKAIDVNLCFVHYQQKDSKASI